jgi:chaperone modulatory protein CbpM
MKTEHLITVREFCIYHNIDNTFINSLQQAGLVSVMHESNDAFIPKTELQKLEKMISLYQLDINVAGIEAITHLLDRMEQMQQRLIGMRNRLRIYEEE